MTYESSRATVERLINAKGGTIGWRKFTTVPPNPSTPWIPGGQVPTDYEPKAVLLPMNSTMLRTTLTALATLGYNPDGQTLAGTDQLLMSGAIEFTPSPDDVITIKGKTVKPLTIDTLDPDMTTPILYLIGVKL